MAFPSSLKLPVLLDGATGTELYKRGMPANVCSELWNLEHPEAILELQRGYVEAGTQILYAPTFTANRISLQKHGSDRSVREVCAGLVALSRKAAGGKTLVAGDMSPCGLQMEPLGEAKYEDVISVFREQAQALEDAGVDLFAVETQMSLVEARATVEAVKQVSDKPVFVSFACGPTGRSLWGDDLAEVAIEMEALGADAYGINCCGNLEMLTRLVREIRAKCALPIIAKPNAGLPEFVDGKALYHMTPETLAQAISELYAAGASLFGGCCGTTAAHIAAIRDVLKTL